MNRYEPPDVLESVGRESHSRSYSTASGPNTFRHLFLRHIFLQFSLTCLNHPSSISECLRDKSSNIGPFGRTIDTSFSRCALRCLYHRMGSSEIDVSRVRFGRSGEHSTFHLRICSQAIKSGRFNPCVPELKYLQERRFMCTDFSSDCRHGGIATCTPED